MGMSFLFWAVFLGDSPCREIPVPLFEMSQMKKNKGVKRIALSLDMDELKEKMNDNDNKYRLEMEKKEELEERLDAIKKEKTVLEQQVEDSRKKLKSLVKAGLVNDVGRNGAVARVILDEAIKRKLAIMKKELGELEKLGQRYVEMEERLFSRLRSAGYLADTLFELEQRRSRLLEGIKRKSSLALEKEKGKNPGNRYSHKKFTSPMRKYERLHFSDKGITYRFKKKETVRATGKGKVVHSGSLAPYGNIVMLDHGRGVHSVILGDFIPVVKKDLFIEEGHPIGETINHPGLIYFEVRKNNNIQNTALLMDRKFLAKRRLKSRRL